MDQPNACTEYATQFFTYPPNTISDFVLGTFDAAFTACIEPMEQTLLACSVLDDVPKEDLSKGIELLKSRFQQKMEPINNKLQRFMLEVIFKVPDHVLLPEDSVQRTRYTTKGHKKLLKEIENIKLEIQAEKYKNAVFKGKLKEATETLSNLKATTKEFEISSQNVFRDNKIADLQENSQFIQQQIETCKSKLSDLRELVPQPEKSDDPNEIYRKMEEHFAKRIKLRN